MTKKYAIECTVPRSRLRSEATMVHTNNIKNLIDKGVQIVAPESVEIGGDVDPDCISGDNVVIHAGCRIFGSRHSFCQVPA